MRLVLAVLLLAGSASAKGLGKVVSATGVLTAKGKALAPGAELPAGEIQLSSGTATLAIAGGRLLVTGPARFVSRPDTFRLDLGAVLLALKHGLRKYSVRTPVAVAAVRGTDFFVKIVDPDNIEVCICHGSLEMTAQGMAAKAMTSPDHEGARFTRGKQGVTSAAGEATGHTEEQIKALHVLLDAAK